MVPPQAGTGVPLAWRWADAGWGTILAVPAVIATAVDPALGIPLALGVLPACILPLPAIRRARVVYVIIGALVGVSLLLGALLAGLPAPVAALVLAAIVMGAAAATARFRAGLLLLVLAAPLVGAGLSYGENLAHAVGAAALMTVGGAYAWLVALAWPAHAAPPPAARAAPALRPLLLYGVAIGIGAGIAYLVGVAAAMDHPGWAPAACLLVARPVAAQLELRTVGRVVSVFLGALVALWLVSLELAPLALALVAGATVVGAAATRASRWYITSAFTTLLVFLMLLLPEPAQATQKFSERLVETVLGAGLAVVFGVVLPSLVARGRVSATAGEG